MRNNLFIQKKKRSLEDFRIHTMMSTMGSRSRISTLRWVSTMGRVPSWRVPGWRVPCWRVSGRRIPCRWITLRGVASWWIVAWRVPCCWCRVALRWWVSLCRVMAARCSRVPSITMGMPRFIAMEPFAFKLAFVFTHVASTVYALNIQTWSQNFLALDSV